MDQIEERHAETAIPLGVRDDESEIAFDEPPERLLVAGLLDAAAKLALVIRREPRQPRDGAKVGLQGIRIGRALFAPHAAIIPLGCRVALFR